MREMDQGIIFSLGKLMDITMDFEPASLANGKKLLQLKMNPEAQPSKLHCQNGNISRGVFQKEEEEKDIPGNCKNLALQGREDEKFV